MNVAIIPAAGRGRRMGEGTAKQFLEIGGDPILIHTLRRFEACDAIDAVVVALPEDAVAWLGERATEAGLRKLVRVVAGGAERRDSVALALETFVPADVEVVAVHDGVRPFVTPEQIAQVVARARVAGGAILALRAVDTVKEITGSAVVATLDRDRIALAQTPQAFRYALLAEAYRRGRDEGWTATDDASLVERVGGHVEIVDGSPLNIKITRPDDLPLAEFILGRWEQ